MGLADIDDMDIREEPLVRIECGQGLIKAVRFNSDGQYAITCGSDRTLKLWRPIKSLELKCYRGHSAEVTDAEAKHDNSQFVSCANDKSVIVWDVESGKILRRLRNLAPFSSLCYGHQATTVFAGSADGTVRIFDLRAVNAWEPIQSLTESADGITCCRTSGNLAFTTSLDKCLRTYDIRQGKLAIDTMNVPLNHVSVGRDASTLLVSCLRGSILLMDRSEGQILNEYIGNNNKMFRIESSFVMGNTSVVAGSEDGQVYLWDIMSTEPRMALKHSLATLPVIQSISSDSLDHLLTACSSSLYLWSVSSNELV